MLDADSFSPQCSWASSSYVGTSWTCLIKMTAITWGRTLLWTFSTGHFLCWVFPAEKGYRRSEQRAPTIIIIISSIIISIIGPKCAASDLTSHHVKRPPLRTTQPASQSHIASFCTALLSPRHLFDITHTRVPPTDTHSRHDWNQTTHLPNHSLAEQKLRCRSQQHIRLPCKWNIGLNEKVWVPRGQVKSLIDKLLCQQQSEILVLLFFTVVTQLPSTEPSERPSAKFWILKIKR